MRQAGPEPRRPFAAYTAWLVRSGRLTRLSALWAAAVLVAAALAVARDGPAPVRATPLTVALLALRVGALALLGAAIHSFLVDYVARGGPPSVPPER